MLERKTQGKKLICLSDLGISLGHSSLSEQPKTLWLFEHLSWGWHDQGCPYFWHILKSFQVQIYV